MHKKKQTSPSQLNNFIKPIGLGTLLGVITCSLLLTLLALIFTKSSSPPHSLVEPIMLISAGIGAFTGGYSSARIARKSGMFYGMICSFIMFIFIFTAGLVSVRDSLTMLTIIRLLIMLTCGSIGGIIGVNKKVKNR